MCYLGQMSESELVGLLDDPSHTRICRLEQEILQLHRQNELLTLKISELETQDCKLEKVVSSLLSVGISWPFSLRRIE
jgi:hypothetical protein